MTDHEILTKAIKKAVEGGYHEGHDYTVRNGHIYDLDGQRTDDLIYWHLFAKALWGDLPGTIARHVDENGYQCDGQVILEWQHHLQMMVVAEDPVKYLGENI